MLSPLQSRPAKLTEQLHFYSDLIISLSFFIFLFFPSFFLLMIRVFIYFFLSVFFSFSGFFPIP
jgi:hypothetical protein